jgi:hypothetical protein
MNSPESLRLRVLRAVVAISTVLMVGSASAAFTLVDDFESPTHLLGQSISGVNGWTVSQASGDVVLDPAAGANQVLSAFQTSTTAVHIYKGLELDNDSIGTLFFRFRSSEATDITTGSDISIGMSDIAAPATSGGTGGFNAYEPQVALVNVASGALITPEFRERDAGLTRTTGTFSNGEWYNVWMVIDNTNDLFRVYLQGGSFTEQTLMEFSGESWFTFRNTTGDGIDSNTAPVTADLLSLYIRAGGSHRGPMYLDDFYFDATGQNLVNPIPEPASIALAGFGLFAVLMSRRARQRIARG